MTIYICIIDKVTAESITVEVTNTERPFNVEWKDSLIMSVKIRWTNTAYEFCNYVMEHGHEIDVVGCSEDTFENLIMTEVIRITDPQGYRCKDELEIKFTPANRNENTNRNEEDTMRPSDILIRELHNLVSDTNIWVTPEYKDNNKEDNMVTLLIPVYKDSKMFKDYEYIHASEIQRLTRLGLSPEMIANITQNRKDKDIAEQFINLMRGN